MRNIRVGTRGSSLALTQARWVSERLRAAHPGLDVEIVVIRTTGDQVQDVPLGPEHGASFFTKEIEEALLDGRVDLAVHSCKDLATRMPEGLSIAAFPKRVEPRDVLVSRAEGLHALPAGSRIGTSSPRRRGFLAAARPDLVVQTLRGNVPTRVRAVDEGAADGIILAAAGLLRLGMGDRISEQLSVDFMVPAAGQGALALQVRSDSDQVAAITSALDHAPTRQAVEAERACFRRLEAGCQAPLGAFARLEGSRTLLTCAVATPERVVRSSEWGRAEEPEILGHRVAEAILGQLGVASFADVAWAGPGPRGTRDGE